MSEFVKKGDKYYKKNASGRSYAYELKECLQCKKVTFITYPNGKYCGRDCVNEAVGWAAKNPKANPANPVRNPKVDFILAVDPGGARCGYALYEHIGASRDSILLQSGIVQYDDLTEFLQSKTYATVVVCETYLIRPGLNHGSSGKTIKAIAQVEMWAKSLGKPIFMQQPSILPIAHKITGLPKPKGHLPDDKSAMLHGAYWLASKKWYLNALERSKKASWMPR